MKTNGAAVSTHDLRALVRTLTNSLHDASALLATALKGKRKWTKKPQGLGWDDLNPRERAALRFIASRTGAVELSTIGEQVFQGARARREHRHARSLAQAHSWARNSMRRLLREGLVRRGVGGGTYAATARGRAEVSS